MKKKIYIRGAYMYTEPVVLIVHASNGSQKGYYRSKYIHTGIVVSEISSFEEYYFKFSDRTKNKKFQKFFNVFKVLTYFLEYKRYLQVFELLIGSYPT